MEKQKAAQCNETKGPLILQSDFLQMHPFPSYFVHAEDGWLAASLIKTRLENQQASMQEVGRRMTKSIEVVR